MKKGVDLLFYLTLVELRSTNACLKKDMFFLNHPSLSNMDYSHNPGYDREGRAKKIKIKLVGGGGGEGGRGRSQRWPIPPPPSSEEAIKGALPPSPPPSATKDGLPPPSSGASANPMHPPLPPPSAPRITCREGG
nr:hypothetical protein [Morchella crassipes]